MKEKTPANSGKIKWFIKSICRKNKINSCIECKLVNLLHTLNIRHYIAGYTTASLLFNIEQSISFILFRQ